MGLQVGLPPRFVATWPQASSSIRLPDYSEVWEVHRTVLFPTGCSIQRHAASHNLLVVICFLVTCNTMCPQFFVDVGNRHQVLAFQCFLSKYPVNMLASALLGILVSHRVREGGKPARGV
jgi:hypothetical protein